MCLWQEVVHSVIQLLSAHSLSLKLSAFFFIVNVSVSYFYSVKVLYVSLLVVYCYQSTECSRSLI